MTKPLIPLGFMLVLVMASLASPASAANLIQNPGFESDFKNWTHSHSPVGSTGAEQIVTTGCFSGKCLNLSLGSSTAQSTYQKIGKLVPGKTYLLSAKFKTATTHNARIALRDPDWKNASCALEPKANAVIMKGTGQWETANLSYLVPLTDDCGQSTADHNWSAYLVSNSPAGDANPIYYDDVSLSIAADLPKNWPWRGIVLKYIYPAKNLPPFSDPDPLPKPEDINFLKQTGVNMVTLSLDVPLAITRAKAYDKVTLTIQQAFDLNLEWANRMLDACANAGIVAHVRMQNFPLDPTDITDTTSISFWGNQALLDQVVEYAGKIANNLTSRGDELQAYSMINEVNLVVCDAQGKNCKATIPPQWPGLRDRIITAIRGNDAKNKWIVFSPGPGGMVTGYNASSDPNALQEPLDDPKIIYNHHFYQPHPFASQFANSDNDKWLPSTYPGKINGVEWNKARMEKYLEPLIEFQEKYHVLVNTGEFSAIRWANGSSQWLQDAIDLFEKYGFSWAFFAYKENNIWDPRFKEFTYETWKSDYAQWLADCKSGGNTTEECWLAFIQQYRGERGYWDVCQPGKKCSCKYGDNFSGLSLCWRNDYQGYDTKRWAVLKAAYAMNPTKCGNSICDPGETPASCPADCLAYTKGVYAMCGANATLTQNVLDNPGLVGILLGAHWRDIEKTDGDYNWSKLDAKIAEATSHGKKVTLQITNSPFIAPDWLNQSDNVTQRVTLTSLNKYADEGNLYCKNITFPAFWDPYFHQKRLQLIQAAGRHFAGNPAVVGIIASYANTYSPDSHIETFIGYGCSKTCGTCQTNADCPAGETCSQINQVQSWLNAGYTHEKMLQVGKDIVDATAKAFPKQAIKMPVSITHSKLDGTPTKLAEDITSYAYGKYPTRYYAQVNFISTKSKNASQAETPQFAIDNILLLIKNRSPQVGLQMADMTVGGEKKDCRQNGFVSPCPAYEVMQKSLDISLSYNPSFIEVWCQDATNKTLEPLLVAATNRMNGKCKPSEICGNQIDDDCDGLTDEGCPISGSSMLYGVHIGYLFDLCNNTIDEDLFNKIENLNASVMRFPGGTNANYYRYQIQGGKPKLHVDAKYRGKAADKADFNIDLENVSDFFKKADAKVILVLNLYNEDSYLNNEEKAIRKQEALDFIGKMQELMGSQKNNIVGVELGNELYGEQYYTTPIPTMTQRANYYASFAKEFSQAIRANYPQLKIAVPVNAYNYGKTGWNDVLSADKSYYDAYVPHIYATTGTEGGEKCGDNIAKYQCVSDAFDSYLNGTFNDSGTLDNLKNQFSGKEAWITEWSTEASKDDNGVFAYGNTLLQGMYISEFLARLAVWDSANGNNARIATYHNFGSCFNASSLGKNPRHFWMLTTKYPEEVSIDPGSKYLRTVPYYALGMMEEILTYPGVAPVFNADSNNGKVRVYAYSDNSTIYLLAINKLNRSVTLSQAGLSGKLNLSLQASYDVMYGDNLTDSIGRKSDRSPVWNLAKHEQISNIASKISLPKYSFGLLKIPLKPTIADLNTLDISSSRANIMFTTKEPGQARIEYGLTRSLGRSTQWKDSYYCKNCPGNYPNANTYQNIHSHSLSGLKPSTTYYYRAVYNSSSGPLASPIKTFTTSAAVSIPADFFAAAGAFGSSELIKNLSDTNQLENYFKLTSAAGIKEVRMLFSWGTMESKQGKFNYKLYDEVVRLARKYDIRMLALTTGPPNWSSSCWERGGANCNSDFLGYPPKNLGSTDINKPDYYRLFLENLSAHNRDSWGGYVKDWEIRNEVNAEREFLGTPEDYVAELKVAYNTIKQFQPDSQVISVGLSRVAIDDGYFEELIYLNFQNYCDGVGYHPYSPNVSASLDKINFLIGLLESHGIHKPLWLTEIGWNSRMDTMATDNLWRTRPDEYSKATALVAAYENIYRLSPKVSKTFWFAVTSIVLKDSQKVSIGYRLMHRPGEPICPGCINDTETGFILTPAYYAYKELSGQGSCGNSVCDPGETCSSCPQDCGSCTACSIGQTRPCPLQLGVCSGSFEACAAGSWPGCSASNYGSAYQETETSCDGLDNDCDGATDEACDFNVIVIGWDGVQREHFFECYDKVLSECPNGLPNIRQVSGGRIFNLTVTNGDTATKAGWTQLFTGYNADVTGVYTNGNYRPIPLNYSVFEKIESKLGKDNVATLFITGKDTHTGGDCPGEGGEPVTGKGEPWCLVKTKLDYYQDKVGANKNVGQKAMELLKTYQNKRIFALFHFQHPDAAGHTYGENSAEYTNAIIDDDYWLGQIIGNLTDLGIYDKTFIYIVTDHGFDEGKTSHSFAPFGVYATNDPAFIRSGDRRDFAPTLLKKYSITLGAIENPSAPPVNGTPLDIIPSGCIKDEAYIDYVGSPACCSGYVKIGFGKCQESGSCLEATGAPGDKSGYCSLCGNGVCTPKTNENKCNCPQDCGACPACSIGQTRACPLQLGVCSGSFEACAAGSWSGCSASNYGPYYQATEAICDSKDNDCDGQIDEGVKTTYYLDSDNDGYGNPSVSIQACSQPSGYASNSQDCNDSNPNINPDKAEACNGIDDDCDGQADEGCGCVSGQTRSCSLAHQGKCSQGTEMCQGGYWTGCPQPSPETCNGIDDNCNGETDEGVCGHYCGDGHCNGNEACHTCPQDCGNCPPPPPPPPPCADGQYRSCSVAYKGKCGFGTETCSGGNWSGCPKPSQEICNQIDDNCDGYIDNGISCVCNPGQSVECGSNVGECRKGTQHCLDTRTWGSCMGEVRPFQEICDGKDNDCDGRIDNGCPASPAINWTLQCQNGPIQESGCYCAGSFYKAGYCYSGKYYPKNPGGDNTWLIVAVVVVVGVAAASMGAILLK